ncbi:unnamed protein product [Rotaria sp. Silwood2]|nr:unnamed protein product [Rotaria sp. Silwood2]CAF2796054.1 unnamed protein product [Rotaria sp. Silwood2]CAF3189922.1 unnamed protein product [Rotaria sp. Silwood2]CAF4061086.1 unnamed protein product [Rotaria sp. Silwood2]CAF4114408.1 unnamed protein product [Rotaria sp. Silwood2]
MKDPPNHVDQRIMDRIHGSMMGMALGDAVGAHVEFRPRHYLVQNPVTELKGGGTWGLKKGQFTDDTSMALCLANSLVARRDYVPYDQLVRYKWWYRDGYMSSTGTCFDIGAATRQSLGEFERRQTKFAKKHGIPLDELDFLSDLQLLEKFDVNCSKEGVAGNGPLMRLAPVPLFFYKYPTHAVEYSGCSGLITHGDDKARDACRYYGALIVAAVNGTTKEELLNEKFYKNNKEWFGDNPLHPDIESIAQGSYRKDGYDKGIRGKGYIVSALEAALWAFWSDNNSFREGVLAAVNLGDDTDTTAAIYGQLAGACYGYEKLPKEWTQEVYAKGFIKCLSKWIAYEGMRWSPKSSKSLKVASMTVNESTVIDKNRNTYLQSPRKECDARSGCVSKLELPTGSPTDSLSRSRSLLKMSETLMSDSNAQSGDSRVKSAERQDLKCGTQRKVFRFVTMYIRPRKVSLKQTGA